MTKQKPSHNQNHVDIQEFGSYLLNLRTNRRLTAREVEEKTTELFPDDKTLHVSSSYLTRVENGKVKKISPDKLKALSQVYGENYNFILFKAGYLDKNPFKNKKDLQTLRDEYFDALCQAQKWRNLTQDEKLSIEGVIKSTVDIVVKR